MDLATIIGYVGALGMVIGAMVLAGGLGPFGRYSFVHSVRVRGTAFCVLFRSLHRFCDCDIR